MSPPPEEPAPRRGGARRPGRLGRRLERVDWADDFARLARTHAISIAGEALVAISLAGSLFFKVDPSAGRQKVLLGLLLTIAPFALVAPLIGPFIDRVRGGHRAVVQATMALRAVLAVAMAVAVASDSLTLFPEAFVMLVLARTYQVARAALVPAAVPDDAGLVEANSKLQVLSGIVTTVAGIPGVVLLQLGPSWTLVAASICFGVGTVAARWLPAAGTEPPAAGSEEDVAARAELRSPAVVSAGAAMSAMRAIVGLVTFLVAFELRGGADRPDLTQTAARVTLETARRFSPRYVVPEVPGPPPSWHFGVVVVLGVLGGLAGAALAPRLRAVVAEERILVGSVAAASGVAVLSLLLDGLGALALLALGVSVAASAAKQAFDAVVQRDAPDADRGRLFARYEARFQLAWVLGALGPVAVRVPVALGATVVAVLGAAAAVVASLGAGRVAERVRAGAQRLRRSEPTGPTGTGQSSSG